MFIYLIDFKLSKSVGNLFGDAFDLFQKGAAIYGAFEEGKELGVTPSSIYISRCEYLLKNPPDNWDGIWTLTEK